jgi:predicted nuclease of predicted toxin-antitoxin system
MRLIFDENMPFTLARELPGHECSSVIALGWRGTENGALLTRAEQAGFDVLMTLDDDISPEQNMKGRKIAVLVVKPAKQGKSAMKAMADRVLFALTLIQPGQISIVAHDHES